MPATTTFFKLHTKRTCLNYPRSITLGLADGFQAMSPTLDIQASHLQSTKTAVSFFFFRLFPSGVATADFPSPVDSINCILLRHFNLSHVLFHHMIHSVLKPLWVAVTQRSTNYLAPVVVIATSTGLFIPWTFIHLQFIYTSDVILYARNWCNRGICLWCMTLVIGRYCSHVAQDYFQSNNNTAITVFFVRVVTYVAWCMPTLTCAANHVDLAAEVIVVFHYNYGISIFI